MLDQGSTVRNRQRQNLSAQEIEVFGIILDLLCRLFDTLALINNRTVGSYELVKRQVTLLVESFPKMWQISDQELEDIQMELQRLRYMVYNEYIYFVFAIFFKNILKIPWKSTLCRKVLSVVYWSLSFSFPIFTRELEPSLS